MSSTIADLLNYSLEVDWLLMWFPVRVTSTLAHPHVRGGTFKHRITEFGMGPFGGGMTTQHPLGMSGTAGQGDGLAVNNAVHGFITIGATPENTFAVELEVVIGRSRRRSSMVLQPDTRTPFMINLHAAPNEESLADTAVVLHGVFVAAPRFNVFSQVARILRP